MDDDKKNTIIYILKDFFGFAKTFQVLYHEGSVCAIIFGINCDINTACNGLIFSGHIDTVLNKGEYMYDDTCFYGRGTSDMKSFFSCLKNVFENLDFQKIKIPMIVIVSFDEETNNKGISSIKEYLLRNGIKHKFCIVGEPTLSACSLSSFGCYDFGITIEGREGHICNNENLNAIDDLLKCVKILNSFKNRYQKTIIKITYVHAGNELNVSPDICKLGFQIRTLNTESVDIVCKELMASMNSMGIYAIINNFNTGLPPFGNRNSYIAEIVKNNNGGRIIDFPASTEAGVFQDLGIDTVICGPGNIRMAHAINEHIYYSDMYKYKILLEKCIEEINRQYT